MNKIIVLLLLIVATTALSAQDRATLEGPKEIHRFDVAEFVVRIREPEFKNAFTDVQLNGIFSNNADTLHVTGFADSQDGSIFRLRFSPSTAGVNYHYNLILREGTAEHRFSGVLKCIPSLQEGPVEVDKEHPKHFIYSGSKRPFYHLGYTAYHLLDPSNDDVQVDSMINYCAQNGYNKIRFVLTGYARDNTDTIISTDDEHGADNPSEMLQQRLSAYNYGALPGRVNHLPAWLGKPHQFDFSRFNVSYWQRVDRAVRKMRDRGIVAACIFTIEKQGLMEELGALTEQEVRLYRYAVARLSAFDNVWWDLGNEHNETRDVAWGNVMGALLKQADPYDRLASAHAYADFLYNNSPWADYIITQQYGNEQQAHDWTLKYLPVQKPYINEEYGYEGNADTVGHSQNRDRILRCHWAIAMAGGYATYGDWSGYVSYFYMAIPGPGKAAVELKYLRFFFEELPFREMEPQDNLTSRGFCLAQISRHYVFYFPRGGTSEIDLRSADKRRLNARWFNPRTGEWKDREKVSRSINTVAAPTHEDWILYIGNKIEVK